MSKINLNDDSYNASVFPEFNNGKAGIVENLSVSVIKKLPDEQGKWDYRIDFKPAEGAGISLYMNYIEEDSENLAKRLTAQGVSLKHLIHTLFGQVSFPEFTTAKEMLDWCMTQIPKFKGTVRLAACFGTKKKPRSRIGIKNFVPFIENMEIPKTESKLKFSAGDNMVPIEPEVVEENTKKPEWMSKE